MSEVTFKYDALGRRIKKRSSEKTTKFIRDGNAIFHEYFSMDDSEKLENMSENSPQSNPERPANLITWVFNDGFVPSAKLISEGNYSIISDYLGTPVEAYDEQGKKVWSAALDIYGRVNEFTGEQDFIPFRYQGQYEDVEIGLYYNRFRYYDPVQGNYTQVDPIGLVGGNPTLYGYVSNSTIEIDPFGLDELYALVAMQDGWYDVMEWGKKNPVGQMFLKEGELWKIGTSKNANSRYTQKYLNKKGVTMKIMHSNVSNETVKYLENIKIRGYEQWKGFLPPGNKCRH